MRMMVYWTLVSPEATFHGTKLLGGPDAMRDALALMEIKRSEGARFVCWASEDDEQVGKSGVDVAGRRGDGGKAGAT